MSYRRPTPSSLRLSRTVLIAVAALTAISLIRPGHAASAGMSSSHRTQPGAQSRMWLPLVSGLARETSTGNRYETIPVTGNPTDRPAASHADLNLALRGYERASAALELVFYNGPTDSGAPQLAGIFADRRVPEFTSAQQVYDWNWSCGPDGCRGPLLASPPVTLLGMRTRTGEPLAAPSRSAEIYGGGYRSLVLYAEASRLTLKYTREDNVVRGYTVHLEGLSVDPGLLALYRQANAAGRSSLPALRNDQPLGTASGSEIRVAVRDNGSFLDPRSRKDWWQGY